MARKHKISPDLDYLHRRPIKVKYVVIAGEELHPVQMYDLVFDETDLKIRQLDTEDNKIYLREVQSK